MADVKLKAQPGIPLPLPLRYTIVYRHTLSVRYQGLNPGPHAWWTTTALTEPPLKPLDGTIRNTAAPKRPHHSPVFLKQRLRVWGWGLGLQQRTAQTPRPPALEGCAPQQRVRPGQVRSQVVASATENEEAMKGVGTWLPFVQTSEKDGKI